MQFDRAYYRRFYFDPKTAVANRREMAARARLIAALTEHAGLPVRRILEAGCGTGMLRAPLKRLLPRAHYTGLETSEYLCERYGWEHGRIEQYRAPAPFDLVICYDVLQYLDDRAAAAALANFGRLCRGVLYFSALTRSTWSTTATPRAPTPTCSCAVPTGTARACGSSFARRAWGSGCGAARRLRSGSWSRTDRTPAWRAAGRTGTAAGPAGSARAWRSPPSACVRRRSPRSTHDRAPRSAARTDSPARGTAARRSGSLRRSTMTASVTGIQKRA